MKDKARQFWDKNAGQFDENEKKSDPLYEDIITKTSKYLDPNDNVLDCFKDDMALKDRLKFMSYRIRKKLGLFPLHLNMFKSSDVGKLISDRDFKIIDAEKMSSWISFYFVVAKKGRTNSE